MTDIDTAGLREKLAAATEGPMAVWSDLDYQGFKTVGDAASYREILEEGESDECDPIAHVYSEEDAALIVSVWNELPAMLDFIDMANRTYETFDIHRNQAEARARDTDARLVKIGELLSSLDLNSSITREGTAWGSILREALALTLEPRLPHHVDGDQ